MRTCPAVRLPACLPADEGDAAAQWFTQYLGFPTRLLRYSGQAGGPGSPTADPQRRQVEPEWGLADGASSEVAFADGFPYLLANEVTSLPTHKGGRGSCVGGLGGGWHRWACRFALL
jgi:hypothetical protein